MSSSDRKKSWQGNSRRRNRARRMDAMHEWKEGRLNDQEVQKERWSREAKRKPRIKVKKSSESMVALTPAGSGIVLEQHRRTSRVQFDAGEIHDCRYSPVMERNGENGMAVGDKVLLGLEEESGDYYIRELCARSSKFSRPGPPDREHREQILAANVDQIVLVVAASPGVSPGLIDRYLIVASYSDLPLVLVVNKVDLCPEIQPEIEEFRELVDGFIQVSAHSGEGLEGLQDILKGKFSVLTGHSGVGKSTLIQALIPGMELRTQDVREKDGKGRHTTTVSTLFDLPEGGQVIDTPGIRGLGFWQMDELHLALNFPPFRGLVGSCRFNNCRHLEEPGCGIVAALEDGRLSERFYEGYLRILENMGR